MPMRYDVVGIGNALMDILIETDDNKINKLKNPLKSKKIVIKFK